MTLAHRRAARREREAAHALGTTRVVRARYQKAPDTMSVRLSNGDLIQPEVKSGKRRIPRLVVRALEQAAGYTPGAIPVAIFSDVGGAAIACLPLRDLARLLGLAPEKLGVQLTLALPGVDVGAVT